MYIIYRVENGIKSYLGYDILGYYWTSDKDSAHVFTHPLEAVQIAEQHNGDVIGK